VIIEVKGGVMRDKNFCKNLFFLVRTFSTISSFIKIESFYLNNIKQK
jgi:hypothetical protein